MDAFKRQRKQYYWVAHQRTRTYVNIHMMYTTTTSTIAEMTELTLQFLIQLDRKTYWKSVLSYISNIPKSQTHSQTREKKWERDGQNLSNDNVDWAVHSIRQEPQVWGSSIFLSTSLFSSKDYGITWMREKALYWVEDWLSKQVHKLLASVAIPSTNQTKFSTLKVTFYLAEWVWLGPQLVSMSFSS